MDNILWSVDFCCYISFKRISSVNFDRVHRLFDISIDFSWSLISIFDEQNDRSCSAEKSFVRSNHFFNWKRLSHRWYRLWFLFERWMESNWSCWSMDKLAVIQEEDDHLTLHYFSTSIRSSDLCDDGSTFSRSSQQFTKSFSTSRSFDAFSSVANEMESNDVQRSSEFTVGCSTIEFKNVGTQ